MMDSKVKHFLVLSNEKYPFVIFRARIDQARSNSAEMSRLLIADYMESRLTFGKAPNDREDFRVQSTISRMRRIFSRISEDPAERLGRIEQLETKLQKEE
jgi:hypothetical protein